MPVDGKCSPDERAGPLQKHSPKRFRMLEHLRTGSALNLYNKDFAHPPVQASVCGPAEHNKICPRFQRGMQPSAVPVLSDGMQAAVACKQK
mmetsp:Transcript_20707/g.51796  ORF Transcript_20707/g.51796 Transcript_20707/m.51796 type:complete len:91 (+) Transcript_20707:67-339(+)